MPEDKCSKFLFFAFQCKVSQIYSRMTSYYILRLQLEVYISKNLGILEHKKETVPNVNLERT